MLVTLQNNQKTHPPGNKLWMRWEIFLLGLLCIMYVPESQAQVIDFNTKAVDFNGNGSITSSTDLEWGPDNRLYVTERFGNLKVFTIVRNETSGDYEVTATETITLIKDILNYSDFGAAESTGNRQITGITVKGTAENPIIYVSSSDATVGGGSSGGDKDLDTNSGIITRLTWNGNSWDAVDLVRGLPRSEENHATNDLRFVTIGNTDYLIVCSGGFTNAGSPSNNFAYITEYALSGAVLAVNLTMLEGMQIKTDTRNGANRQYIYDLPTLDDPTRANVNGITDPNDSNYDGIDVNDPFGGNDGLNMAKLTVGSPVEMFSPGYRNTYSLVITESGGVYVTDNGANGNWGGFPLHEATDSVSNNYRPEFVDNSDPDNPVTIPKEPGSTGPDNLPNASPLDPQVNNDDHLNFVTANIQNYTFGSVYGGHPCPVRANVNAGLYTRGTHSDANGGLFFSDDAFRTQLYDPDGSMANSTTDPEAGLPANWPPVDTSLINLDNADFRQPSLSGNANPDGPEDIIIATWQNNTNGIDEYTASNFGGTMKGNLIAGKSGGFLHRVILANGGTTATVEESKFNTSTDDKKGNPLGITCQGDADIFPGTIWVATFDSRIVVLEPNDFVECILPGEPGYSPTADNDNDGFTNQDEIDNGTDICLASSFPSDNDGDDISDLNDPNDDNDAQSDALDPFQLYNYDQDANSLAEATLPIINEINSQTLDANGNEIGYIGLGLTGLMNNGDTGANYLEWLDDPLADPDDVDDIYGGAIGGMTIYHTTGDALGNQNDQEKAFQQAAKVGTSTGGFIVSGSMLPPFHNWSQTESQGIFIGTGDQDNYIKLVLTSDNNGNIVQVVTENNGTPNVGASVSISIPGNVEFLELFFMVDPTTGSVQPMYSINGGTKVNVGSSFNAVGSVLTAIQNDNIFLAVGVIGTADSDDNFSSAWDNIKVEGSAPFVSQNLPNIDALIDDSSQDINLDNFFSDNGALTYSVEGNTNNAIGASVNNNILTITFPSSAASSDITVRATDADNLFIEQTFTVNVTDEPVPIIRVNAGDVLISATDDGPDWLANTGTGAQSGNEGSINFTVNTGNVGTHNISGKDASVPDYVPQSLFAKERWDPTAGDEMLWTFSGLPNGNYEIRLYMGNGFAGTSEPGQRVFDISIEDVLVEDDLDLSATYGHQVGAMKSYQVTINDGDIEILFERSVENPTVNGIEILQIGGDPIESPIALQTIPAQNSIEGNSISLQVNASGGDGALTYGATGLPTGLTINSSTGEITGSISVGAASIQSIYSKCYCG